MRLPCTHLFCEACIRKWLSHRHKNTCPYCRHVLFTLNNCNRGLAGADRLQIIAQGLQYSRLITRDFDVYSDEMSYSVADVRRAAAAAHQFLVDEYHQPLTGTVLVDVRVIGPHLIAMGNLLRGYARGTGRAYSGYQRRDWKLIAGRQYRLLALTHGQASEGIDMSQTVREYRTRLRESLAQDGVDVISGRFFQRDVSRESPSGDLDVLLNYVLYQAAKTYEQREANRTAHMLAQQKALDNENTRLGRALRWTRQSIFGGI